MWIPVRSWQCSGMHQRLVLHRIWCGKQDSWLSLPHVCEWGRWRDSYRFIRIRLIRINEKTRDLHAIDKLILHSSLFYNNNWHFEVLITWRGPNFKLCFYRRRVRCQLIKIMQKTESLLRTSSLDFVAVSYLSSNAESLVWMRGPSLEGEDSRAHFLLVRAMAEETKRVWWGCNGKSLVYL